MKVNKFLLATNIILILLLALGGFILRDYYYGSRALENDLMVQKKLKTQNEIAFRDKMTIVSDSIDTITHEKITLASNFSALTGEYNILKRRYHNTENTLLYSMQVEAKLRDSIMNLVNYKMVTQRNNTQNLYINQIFKSDSSDFKLGVYCKLNLKLDSITNQIVFNELDSRIKYDLYLKFISSLEIKNDTLITTLQNSNPNLKIDIISNIDPNLYSAYLSDESIMDKQRKARNPNKKLSFGLQSGFGIGYDIYNNNFAPYCLFFGVGIQYKIWEF